MVPLPEDDNMSDDEFDGYIDTDDLTADDDGALDDTDNSPADTGIPLISDFQQPTGPALDMMDKLPFKLFVTDEMLDHVAERTSTLSSTLATQIPRHTLEFMGGESKLMIELSSRGSLP